MKSTLAILSVCLLLFRTGECVTFTLPAGGNGAVNLNAAATTIATLAATGGSTPYVFSITAQTTADTFEIATPADGVITLKSGKSLSTTIPVHILTISVADSTPTTPLDATGKLYITVNTATPAFFATTFCTPLPETLIIDSIIGTYPASDADAGTTLIYALFTPASPATTTPASPASTAASNLFELNSATGVLTAKLAASSSTSATSTVIIHATDTGATNTGSTTVTILKGGTCPSASDSGATVLSAAVMTTAGALAMLHFF